MEWFPPGHTEALALADGEVLDSVMFTHHRAVFQHDFASTRREIGVEERPHGAMVICQAEVLAFRFFGRAQTVTCRFQTGVGFREFAKRENDPSHHLLGKVI